MVVVLVHLLRVVPTGCLDELPTAISQTTYGRAFLPIERNDTMSNLRNAVLALLATSVTGLPQRDDGLLACGEAFYSVNKVPVVLSSCMRNVRILTDSD